jgi:hypothetical protein
MKSSTPIYQVWDGELLIEAPLQTVWRNMLDYPSWQHFPTVKHLSGEPGQEGELVMLKKVEKGFEFPAYHAYTIKLEPLRRVIWKVYLETGVEPYEFFGIVEFEVDAVAHQTLFSYHLLYEFLLPTDDRVAVEQFREQQHESFSALVTQIFPNLKKLSETGSL